MTLVRGVFPFLPREVISALFDRREAGFSSTPLPADFFISPPLSLPVWFVHTLFFFLPPRETFVGQLRSRLSSSCSPPLTTPLEAKTWEKAIFFSLCDAFRFLIFDHSCPPTVPQAFPPRETFCRRITHGSLACGRRGPSR